MAYRRYMDGVLSTVNARGAFITALNQQGHQLGTVSGWLLPARFIVRYYCPISLDAGSATQSDAQTASQWIDWFGRYAHRKEPTAGSHGYRLTVLTLMTVNCSKILLQRYASAASDVDAQINRVLNAPREAGTRQYCRDHYRRTRIPLTPEENRSTGRKVICKYRWRSTGRGRLRSVLMCLPIIPM